MSETALPGWTDYTVAVGPEYAAYLSRAGHALGGLRIIDLGDGRVALDAEAAARLQREPEDSDGHIDDEMQLWLQGSPYSVSPAGA